MNPEISQLVLWTRGPWKIVFMCDIHKFCIIQNDMFTYWPIKYNNGTIGYDTQHPKDVCRACERLMNKFVYEEY